jgi:antitoxin (DNA-binding transcriptional repressor) of toxin-antitoxin stability system
MFYNDVMARIGIRELNQQTSQVLDLVRAGEIVEITDRGVLIAEIRPIAPARSGLDRLIGDGTLQQATVDPAVLDSLPMVAADDVNVGDQLAVDREQERW